VSGETVNTLIVDTFPPEQVNDVIRELLRLLFPAALSPRDRDHFAWGLRGHAPSGALRITADFIRANVGGLTPPTSLRALEQLEKLARRVDELEGDVEGIRLRLAQGVSP